MPKSPRIKKYLQCILIFWLDYSAQTDGNENHRHDFADILTIDGFKEAIRFGGFTFYIEA